MKVNKRYILGLLASFIFFANAASATCTPPCDPNDPNNPCDCDSMSSDIAE